jgi:hypothetical protein
VPSWNVLVKAWARLVWLGSTGTALKKMSWFGMILSPQWLMVGRVDCGLEQLLNTWLNPAHANITDVQPAI